MASRFVIHYGEIGTKGNNRSVFESCLRRNIEGALLPLPSIKVEMANQRFLVELEESAAEEAFSRLGRIFGIAWFAKASVTSLAYRSIRDEAIRVVKAGAATSFAIVSRRANKGFPMTSRELSIRLGDDIRRETGIGVDLSKPGITLHVDLLDDRTVIYERKHRGCGGLPVGVSGRVIHLLSGGIDSPVAAFLMMKRGCSPIYLHFYVAPDVKQVIDGKIPKIVQTLSFYSGRSPLLLLPFSPYQLATSRVPSENEPVLFRTFMRIVAEKLAPRFRAHAISSGDNLAQVASQTLENLACTDRGARLPILRPLLCYDKTEIIELSKRIGTYKASIEPYKDCCSIVSRHPRTKLQPDLVEFYAGELHFESLADETISLGHSVMVDSRTGAMECRPLEPRAASVSL